MIISIGLLFRLLNIANREVDENIAKSAEARSKVIENYGQLLVVRDLISHALENCDMLIELSPSNQSLLEPFIVRHTQDATSLEASR